MLEVRALRPDEIECRAQQVTEKGVMLLLYKDARCDMAVLDEIFTPFGWQRKHEVINGKEFCTVSVKSENGEWVSKQDCGTESNTEKSKGETSDAFKRACVNWGIGRELYTKIFIFISVETVKNESGKYEMKNKFAKFVVSDIQTDNKAKKILHLEISTDYGKKIFEWDNKNPPRYEDIESIFYEYKCQDCGKKFEAITGKDGRVWTAEDIYKHRASQSPDGIVRCKNCLDEILKLQSAGDDECTQPESTM